MKTLRMWARRFFGLVDHGRREAEMDAEIESHLEMHIADNIQLGMSAEEARREAVMKLGGLDCVKEAYRQQGTTPVIEHLLLDIRFALRQLRKSPIFAATAVTILAIGMCATIAIFGFVDAAFLKPLPYADPDALAMVNERTPGIARANLSYFDYRDWKQMNAVFESLEVYTGGGFLLSAREGAQPVTAAGVSGGFFRTLGVKPLLGRDFIDGEELQPGPRVVVLSYGTWQQRFGGDTGILGRAVSLSGVPYTVVGVLPQDFHFAPLGEAEFWGLVDVNGHCERRRSCHNLSGVARLKPGVGLGAAMADVTAIAKRLEQQYPDSNRGREATMMSMTEGIAGAVRPILLVLMAGAVLLLLIACVNCSNLLLARTEARKREIALRRALGASSGRVATQFVTEGVVLVSAAGVIGLVLANVAMRALQALIPADKIPSMPFLSHLGINGRVLCCAAVVAVLALVLFSLAPLVHTSVKNTRDRLTDGARGATSRAWRRVGSRLVVVELSIAMVLLVGAGLFAKSLHRLLHVPLGFQPQQLAMVEIAAPDGRYGKPEQSVALGREITARLQALPGAQSVAIASLALISFNGNTNWIRIAGKPYNGEHMEVNDRDVSADFFKTVRAKLVRGRFFTEEEDLSKVKVVVINQTMANRFFPGEDPIGHQIGDLQLTPKSLTTVIGVVEDIRDGSLESEFWPTTYHPFNQDPTTYFTAIVRTSQAPETLLASFSPAIHSVHTDLGSRRESTMEGRINNSMSAYLRRSSAWLVGGFAVTALFLGVVGLYGVIAYSVSQRTREIGVRMAVGAERGRVLRMILKEASLLIIGGVSFGSVAAVAASTLFKKLLFGVNSSDAQILATVAGVLALSALVASVLPARRAASVNPVEALRAE